MARKPAPNRPQGHAHISDVRSPSSGIPHIEPHLEKILLSLASLLLKNGYGFGRVSKLAKRSFVRAAQEISRRDGAKTSIARIATLTGLTRIEVSRLLKAEKLGRIESDGELNRATRVAFGWASDAQFLNEQGRPRALPLSSRKGSFAQLVRKYSGDIPARAMLIEMKRLGMVRQDIKKSVLLVRRKPAPARATIGAIRAITPWVNLLADTDVGSKVSTLTSMTEQVRIYFETLPQVLASIRELENRRRSFVTSVGELGTNPRSASKFELCVSVAVAAAQPLSSRRKRS